MSLINFDGTIGHKTKKISFNTSMISLDSEDVKLGCESTTKFNDNKIILKQQNEISSDNLARETYTKKETFNYKIYGVIKNYSNNLSSMPVDLRNVKIELYTRINLNEPIASVSANENGEFKFENVSANSYIVRVITPQGYNLIPKGILSDISNITLFSDKININDSDVELKIGLIKVFEVSGITYFDKYNIGIYRYNSIKRNEGINNVLVELFDSDGVLISSVLTKTTTLTDGYFTFRNLINGEYTLAFTHPEDFNNSKQVKNNRFSSMADPKTRLVNLVIENNDVNDVFVGFTKVKIV